MIGRKLTEMRNRLNISQERAAEGLGISRSAYSNYEAGNREPDHLMTLRLAEFYGVSVDYLFGKENDFSSLLKELREQKNMTINQLALYSGVSSAAISKLESGQRGTPKIDTIQKLAKGLRVDVNILYSASGITQKGISTEEILILEKLKQAPELSEVILKMDSKDMKFLVQVWKSLESYKSN